MSTHTPGPWKQGHFVERTGDKVTPEERAAHQEYESHLIRGPGRIGYPECNPVAYVKYANPDDMRLMIAAPDLLAACEAAEKDLVRWLQWTSRACGMPEGLEKDETLCMVRAAIAKAKGEANP